VTPYLQIPIGPSDGRRLFAEYVATNAAHALGIRPPAVRFFLHRPAPAGWPLEAWTDERHLAGETRAWELGAIWVLGELPRPDLACAVAHEVHHVAWFTHYGTGYQSPREQAVMERAADDFAARFTKSQPTQRRSR